MATNKNQPRVLLIEDDQEIRRFLRASLTANGYALSECTAGHDGISSAAMQPPDAMILDLGLPDVDGIDVIRQVRSWSRVPIIVLSARGQEEQKVAALDAGADDYLTKPFGISELLARPRVALRHNAVGDTGNSTFMLDQLQVDFPRRKVLVKGKEVHLTPIEYKLLTLLIKHAGKVLTHRQLLKEVWGPDSTDETHYLRVYMNLLRHKIEPDAQPPRYILTEPGVGYRFVDE